MTTVGVVLFPGTNCEYDVMEVVRDLGGAAEIVWHADATIAPNIDALVLPGGFAHGDYLRTGAIARFSPVMSAVAEFAAAGGPVLGICNGFQVLCEAGLLPGALQRNAGLKFRCAMSAITVATTSTAVTSRAAVGQVLQIPINHFEGNYTCAPETLARLRSDDRSCSATSRTRMDRSTTSLECATRLAMSWVSCHTPSAPATACSARSTARC
jgi:phosphoribosylformylglycinamidine synthase I